MSFFTKKEKYAFVRGLRAGANGKRPFKKGESRRSNVKETLSGEKVKYTNYTPDYAMRKALERSHKDPFAKK